MMQGGIYYDGTLFHAALLFNKQAGLHPLTTETRPPAFAGDYFTSITFFRSVTSPAFNRTR